MFLVSNDASNLEAKRKMLIQLTNSLQLEFFLSLNFDKTTTKKNLNDYILL